MSKESIEIHNTPLPRNCMVVQPGGSGFASAESAMPVIATLDVSTCAAVIVRNPEAKQGYLGHFAAPSMLEHGHGSQFNEMLEKIADTRDRPEALEVWVGGTSMSGIKTPDHSMLDEILSADRNHVINELGKLVPKDRISIEWLADNSQMDLLVLDMSKSTMEFITRPLGYVEDQEMDYLQSLSKN